MLDKIGVTLVMAILVYSVVMSVIMDIRVIF